MGVTTKIFKLPCNVNVNLVLIMLLKELLEVFSQWYYYLKIFYLLFAFIK